MSSDQREHNDQEGNEFAGIPRRDFLAAGAVGIAAAGLGMNSALAAGDPPPMRGGKLRTNSKTGVRTAIVSDTQLNMGPYIAKDFAERGYNLVIADVIMPRCGGAEVEEAVRELRPKLPVLFSSGYGDALAETGTASGARRSVILKPYSPRELLRAVRELLDASGADRVEPRPN